MLILNCLIIFFVYIAFNIYTKISIFIKKKSRKTRRIRKPYQLISKNKSINKNQPISKNPFKRRIAFLVRCFFVTIVVKVIQYYINRKQPIEKSRGKRQRDGDGNIILILFDLSISL